MVRSPSAAVRALACLGGMLCCWSFALAVASAPPVPPAREPSPSDTDKPAPDRPSAVRLDDVKLPGDAILVICERAAEAMRVLPQYYYAVPPEKYDALVAEVAKLERQLQQARQFAPINKELTLTGRVHGGLAELKAVFEFDTDKERSVVALGCRQALPTAIRVDDKVARVVSPPGEPLAALVEGKGEHKVTVEMLLRLREQAAPRPGARDGAPADPLEGFELDLPLSPVTNVKIDLPPGVKGVEVNDQPPLLLKLDSDRLEGGLESKGTLKVAWRRPAPAAPVSAAAVRGAVTVTVQPDRVQTVAELTLRDLAGSVQEWALQLPPGAQVRPATDADKKRIRDVQGSGAKDGRVRVRLHEPGTAALAVRVEVRQPREAGPLLVGPFAVLGAASHAGTLWVVGEPDQRVRCQPAGAAPLEVAPQKLAEDPEDDRSPPGAVARFRYWGAPPDSPARDPWFRLEIASVKGELETAVEHTLRLRKGAPTPGEARGEGAWQLTTVVSATPVRTGVDELAVEWPVPWQFDQDRWPEGVADLKEEPARRLTRFELSGESLRPFKLRLEARPEERPVRGGLPPAFPAVQGHPGPSAVIRLPRPVSTRPRGEHRVVVLALEHDLRAPQPANPGLELVAQEAHRLEWRADHFPDPAQVAVAWQDYRPEVRADATVDVTLGAEQVLLEHRIELAFGEGDRPPPEVELRLPKEVTTFPVVSGGREAGEPSRPDRDGVRTVRCALDASPRPAAGGGGRPAVLVLRYHVGLPRAGKDGGTVGVPLVAVGGATHSQTKVRVWAPPGWSARPQEEAWERLWLEAVPGRQEYPLLVLRSLSPSPRLNLRWGSPAGEEPLAGVQVERALMQVRIAEGGFQHYRARFRLRNLTGQPLDLGLPPGLDLQATLDGKRVEFAGAGDAAPDRGRPARLRLPARPGAAVLEVTYQLMPGRTAEGGAVWTVLRPVTLPGLRAGVPTRWQVDLPPGWVPLSMEAGPTAPWLWERRGWLLAPRPAVTAADLEAWFSGEDAAPSPGEEAAAVPGFVCWRGAPAPVTLYHVPQQAWLLVCSLGLLGLGLVVCLLPGGGAPPRLFWPQRARAGQSAAAVGRVWPGLLGAVIYGAQPGLAVLLVVLPLQWLLQERYRRRVVFLPGFRRLKPGSSLVRAGPPAAVAPGRPEDGRPSSSGQAARGHSSAHPRKQAEPSTVDEPAAEGEAE